MKLQLLNLFGLTITAMIPAIVAALKTLKIPKAVIPVLPLLLGALAFLGAGFQQGAITNLSGVWEFLVTGLASGGIASSARDIWNRAIANPRVS